MDEKRNDCEVCFHDFDHRERRPRVIPCGHTFCSKCVRDNSKENLLLCPICRKEHHAETAADFPDNFRLESFLLGGISIPSTPDEISSPATDQLQTISKKLTSMRAELCSGIQNKATSNKEIRSQLHQYENLLNEKEMLHHKIKEKYLDIAQQNGDFIQIIRKERARIAEALEKEEETQRMKIVTDKLHAANNPHEVILALEEADHCYDVLDTWNQESQENFPNIQLITKSVVLVEQYQILLQTLPDNRGEAAVEESTEVRPTDNLSENMASLSMHGMEASSLLNPKLSIQEKVARALENASIPKQTKTPVKDFDEKSVQTETNAAMTELISEGMETEDPFPLIESLRIKSGLVMHLMKQKRLFAVQELNGRRRFAQISLKKKRILLHYLKDQMIPSNAHLLQHNDVLKLVNVSSRVAFLELRSVEREKTLGKLFIRLSPDGKRAQQFALLCSGQNGPSYVGSNILYLENMGYYSECVQCGDYENLGGSGGRALVPDVLKEAGGVFERPWVAGTVSGKESWRSEATAAQFEINTRYYLGEKRDFYIGIVEEGLPILREAVDNHDEITTVFFSDAGLVLDI